MEATKKRHINPTRKLDYLFNKPEGDNILIKENANIKDTLEFIPKVVHQTAYQTKELAQLLKRSDLEETCRSIWNFVYEHIAYRKDARGKEQIRSPIRTWRDRFKGVDCDCYSVFISSILTNLNIPHALRVTKYGKPYYQHIYPIVPLEDGSHITLDCVVDKFNYEEPFSQKKDTIMDLEFLNGFDVEDIDFEDMEIELALDEENIDDIELGKLRLFRRKTSEEKAAKKAKKQVKKTVRKEKRKKFFSNIKDKAKSTVKKVVHSVNRVNPVAVAARSGLLAAMKLNTFKFAQRIKYGYLSEAEAKKKGIDLNKWRRLVTVKNKLEKLYFGAGGKQGNLKKTILTGKGNRNKEVALGMLSGDDDKHISAYAPLSTILGEDVYLTEEFDNVDGLGSLGAITPEMVSAAVSILKPLIGLIKNIGSIFPKKSAAGSEDFENTATEDAKAEANVDTIEAFEPDPSETAYLPEASSESFVPSTTDDDILPDNPDGEASFWDTNKKWLLPTLIGAGTITVAVVGYKMVKSKPTPASNSLSGTKKRKKKKSKKKTIKLKA